MLTVSLLLLCVLLSACNFLPDVDPTEPERTVFEDPPTLALPATGPTELPKLPTATAEPVTSLTSPTATTPPSTSGDKPLTAPPTTPPLHTAKPPELPKNLITVSGIVEYFNKAANDAKANCKHAFQTLDRDTVIQTYAAGIDITNYFAERKNINNTNRESIAKINLPIKGMSYASRLQPASVENAKCVVSGDNYVITIQIRPESGKVYQDNSYHGQVFSLIESDGEDDFFNIAKSTLNLPGVPKLLDFDYAYSKASIVCRINRKTGKLQSVIYTINQRIEGKSGKIVWIAFEGLDEDRFEFEW
jgi:hypothetical protein